MGKKDSKAKMKKAKERKVEKQRNLKSVVKRVDMIAVAADPSEYTAKLYPSANSVVFKGLTESNARIIAGKRGCALNDFMPPVRDLYAEVPMDNGEIMKIRWVPFEGKFTKSEVFAYIKNMLSASKFNDGEKGTTYCPDSTDEFLATLYVSCGELTSIGYAWMHDLSLGTIILPCKRDKALATEAKESAALLKRYGLNAPKEITDKAIALREEMKENKRIKNLLATYVAVIQRIIYLYLSGEELPRLEKPKKVDPSPRPSPNPPPKHPRPAKGPVVNAYTKCIAYIYFDSDEGSLSISGNRNYSCKWWIVSGHKRHYKGGKIVNIEPYIKGDRSDPDAIKALEEFVGGYRKIQTYKLLVRKAK